MKGWIALDIDGTVTLDKYSVPEPVIEYLRKLEKAGWRIAMATGRSLVFASMPLASFNFPFTILVQNGSAALQMPNQKTIFKRYISPDLIPIVEKALEGIDGDFLVYAGHEKGDFCYWRPERLSQEHLLYVRNLEEREKETPRAVESFESLPPFPLIKCFGSAESMVKVARLLRATELFQVAHIRDPFTPSYQLLLVTDKRASKGLSLRDLIRREGRGERVIAAGDDENDISLFDEADVKIAMPHAPEFLQERADLIAPPTRDLGIITALEMAIQSG